MLGLIDQPITVFLFSPFAVVITLTHYTLPLAILPIYGALRGIGDVPLEAARDVGARPRRVFLDIVLPQARIGLISSFSLTFLFAAGDYVTPLLVGGPNTAMIGLFIQKPVRAPAQCAARRRHEFHRDRDLPCDHRAGRLGDLPGDEAGTMSRTRTLAWYAFAALAVIFMLSPLVILVIFCFNDGALLSFPITGLSLKWIGSVLDWPEFYVRVEEQPAS